MSPAGAEIFGWVGLCAWLAVGVWGLLGAFKKGE